MTTISYRQGLCWDEFVDSFWDLTLAGSTASVVDYEGDIIRLKVDARVGDVKATNHDALSLSTDYYKKIRWRFGCDNAAIKAQIIVRYSDSSTQTVLAKTNSTQMTSGSATLTAAKTVQYIDLYACDSTGSVFYDFVMVYGGDFTIPNSRDGIEFFIPTEVWQEHPVGMTGGLSGGNCGLAYYQVRCDLTKGTWKRAGENDHIDGEVFAEIAHRSGHELWQWFETSTEKMKVRIENLQFSRTATSDALKWGITFRLTEFRLSDAWIEDYTTRWGLI